MPLKDLIDILPRTAVSGDDAVEVQGVRDDSRAVRKGDAFVAVRGDDFDGHEFIPAAVEAGAAVIIAEAPLGADAPQGVTWVLVPDTREALALIADQWFGCPSRVMKVAGITGTNGKTTTAFLLHCIMKSTLHQAGLMGTVVFDDGETAEVASHTTPGSLEVQEILDRMRNNGCRGVAMEVSSHGLEQKRTAAVAFDAVVFTNLTQDHLDYHGTMEKYFASKRILFEQAARDAAGKNPTAVVNLDDRYGAILERDFKERLKVTTYGFGAHCGFKAGNVKQSRHGLEFQLHAKGRSYLVRMPLIGRFNVYNALAALAAAAAVRIPMRDAVAALKDIPQVPGRMEIAGSAAGVTVYVDYAHTPDAIDNACRTLRELEPSRLITVFGCGGDRDRDKRARMGKAAASHSDFCVVTSDNPRSEDPAAIIREIEKGMGNASYETVVDRAAAIRQAVDLAQDGDVVLIAGKGHETYQEFATERVDFDDRKQARSALAERQSESMQ
ncbi:MAG: UDP-N-acetylmuramoyl-L-alanyl-D-glutamate--2,6-diaminopimelate ligase [Akkermansiaceae bacterium]|nr:UDP-N-acetylmuramoyl-L-alanyl-D-glutamate--2,6-diaminopimelate ligase [Akkermansiaceae bacterium]